MMNRTALTVVARAAAPLTFAVMGPGHRGAGRFPGALLARNHPPVQMPAGSIQAPCIALAPVFNTILD